LNEYLFYVKLDGMVTARAFKLGNNLTFGYYLNLLLSI